MARTAGSPNKNTSAAPNAVATQLKRQLEEKNTLLLDMAELLFIARDRYMEMAKAPGGDVMLAFEAGRLQELLHRNGFEQRMPTAEEQIANLLPKGGIVNAAKSEEEGGGIPFKLLKEGERVTSIMGQPPAREAP